MLALLLERLQMLLLKVNILSNMSHIIGTMGHSNLYRLWVIVCDPMQKTVLRDEKPARVLSDDLPPSYNVVMDNLDLFQPVHSHEKSETPPPTFQSQVNQTVLTIS